MMSGCAVSGIAFGVEQRSRWNFGFGLAFGVIPFVGISYQQQTLSKVAGYLGANISGAVCSGTISQA